MLVVPPLQSVVVGPYLFRGAWFPSHLPLEGTGLIQIFWVVTGNPWYPWYKDQTVATETSVERVARAVHLMVGRISTDILRWVPPRDSVVTPWG
jgi:hypothetical protein